MPHAESLPDVIASHAVIPVIQFPDRTKEYQAAVTYDQAQLAQAAQEAAQEAQQAQEAQEQAQAQQAPPAPSYTPQTSGGCGDWMAAAGITDVADASYLINAESGCNPYVQNPSSGACGIPQALPCSKLPGYPNDPVTQLVWMQSYVFSSYGSWANAAAHERAYRWY